MDRAAALRDLAAAMTRAASTGGGLVVHGEPSVGKSVLCLQVVDQLRETGAAVVVVDLRDCRPPLPILESVVGVPLSQPFAHVPMTAVRLLVLDGAEVVQEGDRDRFLAPADAARRAGLGVVTVARDDAVAAVEEAFGMLSGVSPRLLRRSAGEPPPRGHAVDRRRRPRAPVRSRDRSAAGCPVLRTVLGSAVYPAGLGSVRHQHVAGPCDDRAVRKAQRAS
ncbi:ATP-binding protein [Streptomyces mirabilis]|uniref:ATP-binding protein n=1 Tax=Streptomyces mirabilis TaxID=68239 RepID=UPI003BEEB1F3